MRLLILLISALLFSSFVFSENPKVLFEKFKKDYNKNYETKAEEIYRFGVFISNLKIAEKLNSNPKNKAVYGVTKFSDLTREEFASTYLTYKPKTERKIENRINLENRKSTTDYPPSYSWVSQGATTPVYNQEQCGSCWAFSATETIESFWFLAGNTLTELSMQQIVSCDETSDGCNGGEPYSAYEYVIRKGIESYSAYPYTSGNGITGSCKYNANDVVAHIANWTYVSTRENKDPAAMQQVTYETGPLSVCVDASTWQNYQSGIITSDCAQLLDHCVQIVGWGTDTTSGPDDGIEYWVVRNSWGTDWGQEGFIWIDMSGDLCGIENEVTIVGI